MLVAVLGAVLGSALGESFVVRRIEGGRGNRHREVRDECFFFVKHS